MEKLFLEFPFLNSKINASYSEETINIAGEEIILLLNNKNVEIKENLEKRAAIYACKRILLSLLGERWINRAIAEHEAKKFIELIKKMADDDIEKIAKIMGYDFNKISVVDYLKNSPENEELKLVNLPIQNGLVSLGRYEKIHFLAEVVRKKFIFTPKIKKGEIPDVFLKMAKELKKRLPKPVETKINLKGGFAPCIETIIERMGGEKMPNTARWILAVYLINIGLNDEAILKIFERSADFKRDIVDYQIKHIRNTGYKVPKCSSIDSYGLCIPSCPLKKRGSPLTFSKLKR